MSQKHLPKGSLIASLDIGSSKIACFIAQVVDEDGDLEVLGAGYQASNGIKAGTIIDIDALEASIRKTVHAAENMAAEVMRGYPLREIIINVPAIHSRTNHVTIDLDIDGAEVTSNDINRAILKAQAEAASDEHELIHTIPANFVLDGKSGITDPEGMHGKTLGVDVTVIHAASLTLRNMAGAIERSHLDIASACVNSYASGLSCLVEDEMTLGTTLIDIGGGTTSIAVFHAGKLIYTGAIPVGGKHVTSDIARGLNTPINDAERIKTLYGSALASSLDDTEVIDVPILGEELGAVNHVQRSMLVGIIQARVEEIFEMVRAKLDEAQLLNYLGRNVVLTGGASQMPGMRELAQRYLDKQVRVGKPHVLSGVPDMMRGPAFSCVTGLLFYIRDRFDEQPQEIIRQIEPGSLLERIRLWFRENW